jgi:hypothetical protein
MEIPVFRERNGTAFLQALFPAVAFEYAADIGKRSLRRSRLEPRDGFLELAQASLIVPPAVPVSKERAGASGLGKLQQLLHV